MQNTITGKNRLYLIFVTLLLILLAGFRPLKYFRDTDNYKIMIDTYVDVFEAEPTFWLINQFNQLFDGSYQSFFLLYAILGVSIKALAIERISPFPLISLYLYVCLYFILHEMTQIRVGVASAVFLLAIPDIVNKNHFKYSLKTAIAISFHYSAVIMICLYFLSSKKINKKFYYLLPLIGGALSLDANLMINILHFAINFLPSFLSDKITTYLFLLENDQFNKINIFNVFIICLVLIYYFFLFNLNKLHTSSNIILIKLFSIYLFIFYGFSSVPVFSFRLSGFIGIALVITIPSLIAAFNNKIIPMLVIFIWGGGYLWFVGIGKIIDI